MSIASKAKAEGYTRYIIACQGENDLYLYIKPNTDLDSRFVAICADTGDKLRVSGWNADIRDLDDR